MGIGIKELLVILVVVLLVFGTKRLRHVGTDLGAAIKGFRKSMTEEETDATLADKSQEQPQVKNDKVEKTTSDEKAQ